MTQPGPSVHPVSMELVEWVAQARRNLDNGWAPIPVGKESGGSYKNPWVGGHHGFDGVDAARDQLKQLARKALSRIDGGEPGILSLGLRLPPGALAIDVDAHGDKKGKQTLADWEARWGRLPDTYTVTARDDGVSGRRLYRVSEGFYPKETPGSGVEFLDRYHRYTVAPPSWHHTGNLTRLIAPDGSVDPLGVLPPPDQIPWLPDTYLARLPQREAGAGEAGREDVQAFAARYDSGAQSAEVLEGLLDALFAGDSRHDAARNALCVAAREAKGGRYPFKEAVRLVRDRASTAYTERGDRLDLPEFKRTMAWAVGQTERLTEEQCRDRWQSPEHVLAVQDYDNRVVQLFDFGDGDDSQGGEGCAADTDVERRIEREVQKELGRSCGG